MLVRHLDGAPGQVAVLRHDERHALARRKVRAIVGELVGQRGRVGAPPRLRGRDL